jgi:hexosaminidase
MCSWEQTEDKELPSLRQRLAAMSERLWNPGFNKGFDEFSTRLDRTDKKFTTLLDNEALKAPVPVRTGNAGK